MSIKDVHFHGRMWCNPNLLVWYNNITWIPRSKLSPQFCLHMAHSTSIRRENKDKFHKYWHWGIIKWLQVIHSYFFIPVRIVKTSFWTKWRENSSSYGSLIKPKFTKINQLMTTGGPPITQFSLWLQAGDFCTSRGPLHSH